MKWINIFLLATVFLGNCGLVPVEEEELSSRSTASSTDSPSNDENPSDSPSNDSSSSDTTSPSSVVVSINSGKSATISSTVTLGLTATDDQGVTHYYLSETNSIPSSSASGWTSISTTTSYSDNLSYTFTDNSTGNKTIYTWFKDAAENISATASDTIEVYDLTTNLMAHYSFSGNTQDVSGNNHDGNNNGAVLTTDRFSSVENSYSFTPSSSTSGQYIEVPYHSDLAPTSGISFGAWVYSDNWSSLCSGTYRAILSKAQFGGYEMICENDMIRISVYVDGSYYYLSTSVTNLNGWHHFMVTYNSSTQDQVLYQDGVSVGQTTLSLSSSTIVYNYNNSLIIGGEAGSGSTPVTSGGIYQFMNGKIDEVRIYSSGLSSSQVSALYTAEK